MGRRGDKYSNPWAAYNDYPNYTSNSSTVWSYQETMQQMLLAQQQYAAPAQPPSPIAPKQKKDTALDWLRGRVGEITKYAFSEVASA